MKMKYLFTTLLIIGGLTSCSNEYSIQGTSSLSTYDNQTLYLRANRNNEQAACIDSTQVIHGHFTFEGSADSTVFAQLYMGDESVLPIILEKGNLQISLDVIEKNVTGGELNKKLYAFLKKRASINSKIWATQQKAFTLFQQGKDVKTVEKRMGKKIKKLNRELERAEENFILENAENILGPSLFRLLCRKYQSPIISEQIYNILEACPKNMLQDNYIRSYVLMALHNPQSKAISKNIEDKLQLQVSK